MGEPIKLMLLEKTIGIITEQGLLKKAVATGKHLTDGMKTLEGIYPGTLHSTRGRGLFCAVNARDTKFRDKIISSMLNRGKNMLF